MVEKEVIEELYFNQKNNLTEISKKITKSVSYISKILRQNEKYVFEKEKRKKQNLEKRRKKQKEYIYKSRKQKSGDFSYQQLKTLHEQATKELSKGRTMSNQTLRKWCPNSYKYDSVKRRYEFDGGKSLKPADFPKYIKL